MQQQNGRRKHHETWVSLNRQNIKWFASTPVTDFRAGRARFDISVEFFQKIIYWQEWRWNTFFLKTGFKIGVHIIHGCALYTGKYGILMYQLDFSPFQKCFAKIFGSCMRSQEEPHTSRLAHCNNSAKQSECQKMFSAPTKSRHCM